MARMDMGVIKDVQQSIKSTHGIGKEWFDDGSYVGLANNMWWYSGTATNDADGVHYTFSGVAQVLRNTRSDNGFR